MIYKTPYLETSRLILKRGNLKDLQKVYEYNFMKLRNINGVFKFEKNNPKDIEGWENPIPNCYDWVVYLKDNMAPIANITADREQSKINAIELAFNTHPAYWRKGYTSEALIEIMKFLFDKGYDNILCGYEEGNFKSKFLGEKLGFIPYYTEQNIWIKTSTTINTYMTILSKERFLNLHNYKTK